MARKNLTRERSHTAFTLRAAAIDRLSLSIMSKVVNPGPARCTRLDKNMKSHRIALLEVHCSRLTCDEGHPLHDTAEAPTPVWHVRQFMP